MKLDLLEILLQIRGHYTDLIIYSAPQTEAEAVEVRRLVLLRDQLTVACNQVIDGQFSSSLSGIEEAQAELVKLNADIEQVARTLASVKEAIDLGTRVLNVISHIVSLIGPLHVLARRGE
jgi:hypothetical protein